MRKHIIVEGCDGTGKDTLIDRLKGNPAFATPLDVHERASTSIGGPIPDLSGWVERVNYRLRIWASPGPNPYVVTPRYIFNRHPLVSEYIYADKRFVRRGLSGRFRDSKWRAEQSRILSDHTILIVCQPPWSTVKRNLMQTPDSHMPGVVVNAADIYDEYTKLVWPGITLRYDYTRDSLDDLIELIKKVDNS